MRKLFLILTIVCLLVTLTIINAIPVSAGTLTITPTAGGPEEGPDPELPPPGEKPPPGQQNPPSPVTEVEIPVWAAEDLSEVAELNPILEYVGDSHTHPGPER